MPRRIKSLTLSSSMYAIAAVLWSGCAVKEGRPEAADATSAVRLALTEVPGDIGCLRLQAQGPTRTVVKNIPLPPERAELTVTIAGLPVGGVTFRAEGHVGTCAMIQGAPTWISDAVALTLVAGAIAPLRITLHRNGLASAVISFDDTVGGTEDCRIVDGALECTGCIGGCGDTGPGRRDDRAASLDRYLERLPSWENPPPARTEVTDRRTTVEEVDGAKYACSVETRDVQENHDHIVALGDAYSHVAPGMLLQGATVRDGSMIALPLRRAPMTLSIDLALENPTRVVAEPTTAAIQSAVSDLMREANRTLGDVPLVPAKLAYRAQVVNSFEQALLEVGVNLAYKGPFVTAGLSTAFARQRTAKTHTVIVKLLQPMFTISTADDDLRTPSDFLHPTVSVADLEAQAQSGRLGSSNLPTYVQSKTYGRFVAFTIQSTEVASAERLQLLANAAIGSFAADASLKTEYQSIISTSDVKVLALGGSQEDALAAIRTGDFGLFFKPAKPSTAVPLSFKVLTLHGARTIAKLGNTLTYTAKECGSCVTETQYEAPVLTFDHRHGEAGGLFGHTITIPFAGACPGGYVRSHYEVHQTDGNGHCGATGWLSGDPGYCAVNVHYGVPILGSANCRIMIWVKRPKSVQPPFCPSVGP